MSWPRPEGISFPGRYHLCAEDIARLIIREIAAHEQVHINVPNENYERLVRGSSCAPARCRSRRRVLPSHPDQRVLVPRPRAGVRPEARRGRTRSAAIVDWGFNAWGGKYPPFDADDACRRASAEELGLPVFSRRIVMEGGAVDFNGAGTVLTTESCLLNKNRNPGLSKRAVERLPARLLRTAARRLARARASTATTPTATSTTWRASSTRARSSIGVEDDPRDQNYARAAGRTCAALSKLRDQDGRPFEIVELPMPRRVEHEGQRLPATYLNFYFINGALLVPTFRDQPQRDGSRWRSLASAPAAATSHRRRLPRADLGPGRDPLPDAAAAGRVAAP